MFEPAKINPTSSCDLLICDEVRYIRDIRYGIGDSRIEVGDGREKIGDRW